ncbi:MAG TPA: DUF2784 domain-containing protein [Candidatus Methylomirabilis sp.]|nr:DUF2784 domain-containing protein [Candidatus Methylomirabilis sp.]
MGYRLLADLLVLVHLAFVLFVVLGGLLVLRWPRLAWLHLPAAAWGACIEAVGWICPLTPLENLLRQHAGEAGYAGGFIEHYIIRLLYPPGLTRNVQFALTAIVVAVNLAVYAVLFRRWRSARKSRP